MKSHAEWQLDFQGHSAYDRTLAILREHQKPDSPPYHLAFSGGKDSVVLLEMARRAEVCFDAYYYVTTIDPPEVTRFVRQHFPEVRFLYPEHSFRWWVQRDILPLRGRRWCCGKLKECHGVGDTILTGVRAEESPARAKRGVVEPCQRRGGRFVHALRDWSSEEVWQFIRVEGLPYCSLYDEGWKRLGCVMCPMDKRMIDPSMVRWPHIWDAVRRASSVWWTNLPTDHKARRHWRDHDAYWQWWLSRDKPMPPGLDEEETQPSLAFAGGLGETE